MPRYVHDIQKKQHRERAQPQSRKRKGLLQKKKDYKLRAQDYHNKQERLKILREKARSRNEDEYYHSMTKKKTDENGILITERETSQLLDVDEVKLLKTQDVNYVKTKRLNEMKLVERIMNGLSGAVGVSFAAKGQHTVFVDDEEEFENFDAAKHFKTDLRLLDRAENRLRLDQLGDERVVDQQDEHLAEKYNEKKLKKLRALKQKLERVEQLKRVEQKMDEQRELMKKGSKKKIVSEDGKVTFKWKNQRKR